MSYDALVWMFYLIFFGTIVYMCVCYHKGLMYKHLSMFATAEVVLVILISISEHS